MATKIKFRRTNAAGLPGRYACDRCGLPARRGVYTGDNTFTHICEWCKGVRTRLIAAQGRGVLAAPRAWLVVGVTEKAERAQTSLRIAAQMVKVKARPGIETGKQIVKARKMALPDYLESVDHGMTTGELSKVLGVSRSSIYDMAQAGRIPCYRVGTHVRFDPHVIGKWLRAR